MPERKQKIISVEELIESNPDLKLNYRHRFVQSPDGQVVVSLDKSKVMEIRYVYHVDIETGKPLYDNFVIYQGPTDEQGRRGPIAGEISVPFFGKGNDLRLGLIQIERPVSINPVDYSQGTFSIEFPRGILHLGKRGGETAASELEEETGFLTEGKPYFLGRINPDTGFVASLIDCYALPINESKRGVEVQSLDERIAKCEFLTRKEIDEEIVKGEIFCGITLATLSLFDTFYKKNQNER